MPKKPKSKPKSKPKVKRRVRLYHRVIGKIKREHLDQVASLPVIGQESVTALPDALVDDEETLALNEPEHILVAVPKSAWDKFCDWLNG